MSSYKQISKVEWLSALFIIPFLGLVLNYLLFGKVIWHSSTIWLYSFPFTVLFIFGFWYFYILSIYWVRSHFPDIKQTAKRASYIAFIHIALVFITTSSIFYIYDAFSILGYDFSRSEYLIALLIGGAATLIVTPLREGAYFFTKWKESLVQKEVMQQLSIKQEFELLKQQVDPHFLFNCFNTLSSLITEDIHRAENFLEELRKVYQYLLSNKQEDFVPLEKELLFIQSYYALLQTRFSNSLELTITVSNEHLRQYIPSLSLQLLVENAVKHNIVSKSRKLYIAIYSTNQNQLVVTNNLQRKLIKGRSFGIGMETIKAKYALYQQKIKVQEDAVNYTVVLPFIPEIVIT
jgi:hypothetical protein